MAAVDHHGPDPSQTPYASPVSPLLSSEDWPVVLAALEGDVHDVAHAGRVARRIRLYMDQRKTWTDDARKRRLEHPL